MAMSSSVGSLEELLTCPICLETYKSPKYLPCLHSFCHTCIQSYILTQKEKEGRKTENEERRTESEENIPCPVCRKLIVLSPGKDAKICSEDIPGNHFLESLLDTCLIRKNEKLCQSCESRNKSNKASSLCAVCCEAFCSDCTDIHKSFKMSRDHKILPISDIDGNDFKLNSSVYCAQHPTELVRIYCNDHKTPCCNTCATIKHRKCNDVTSVEEASTQFRASSDMQKMMSTLNKSIENISSLLKKRSDNEKLIKSQKILIESKIENLRSKFDKHLKSLEEKLRKDLEVEEKNIICDTERFEAELSSLKSTFDNCKSLLQVSRDHGSDIQCLVEYNKVKELTEKLTEDFSEKTHSIQLYDIQFEVDKSASVFVQKMTSLGQILKQQYPINADLDQGVKERRLRAGDVITKFTYRGNSSPITGIFIGDKIVVTEFDNKLLNVLDSTGMVQNSMTLPGCPRSISCIDLALKTIAVSLPLEKKILVIDLNTLSSIRTVDTAIQCWGIDYQLEKMAIANDVKISIIDFVSEKEISSIDTKDAWFVKFDNSGRCRYTSENKIVDDAKNVRDENIPVKSARGIDFNHLGFTYVVGMNSYNLLILSPNAAMIRNIDTKTLGLFSKPWNVVIKPGTSTFLISSVSGELSVCKIKRPSST